MSFDGGGGGVPPPPNHHHHHIPSHPSSPHHPQHPNTLTMPHVLELIAVSHSGPILPSTSRQPSLWSRLTGSTPSGLLLKDVSFEVHSGEMMAILGSKGSGKRALLEVIAHRVSGSPTSNSSSSSSSSNSTSTTRGQILLNDVPLTLRLFQEQCGFVSRRSQLIDGLTVRQTLTYMARMTIRQPIIGRRLADGSWLPLRLRVKQVLADVALSSVSSLDVTELTEAERKRLAIGLQLVRDPLLLVLDDPTSGLCPLDTYFIVSMLSNHVKKYGRIVLFTIDRPRSDVFPFLDRVTFLCLGDVVYTGSTRGMMEYFSSIGFPCPELENPLMYYLCLSTVDRRTRERFIESSAQIAALVDKFKAEGGGGGGHESWRGKLAFGGGSRNGSPSGGGPQSKHSSAPLPLLPPSPLSIPLTAYGKASACSVLVALTGRQFAANFAWRRLATRLGLLPLFSLLLYSFIAPSLAETQNSFQTRSSIIFCLLAAITFLTPVVTVDYFAQHRNRFYEDSSRLALYRGPSLVFTSTLANLPFSLLSAAASASLTYWTTPFRLDPEHWHYRWTVFAATLWGVAAFAEQTTIGVMAFVKGRFRAAVTASTLLTPALLLGSATVRSMMAAPPAAYYLNWFNLYYWAGWTLHFGEFQFNEDLVRVPYAAANRTLQLCAGNIIAGKCVFLSGNHFLDQRLKDVKDVPEWSLVFWKNFAFVFIFALAAFLINTVVYVVPLPASLKAKFRD